MGNETETKKEKIRFKDLSLWLKIGIVGGLANLTIYILSFIAGFLLGLVG